MKRSGLSSAKRLAQERNFTILRLRGIWAGFDTISIFTNDEKNYGKALIDNVLSRMGAEPESNRR